MSKNTPQDPGKATTAPTSARRPPLLLEAASSLSQVVVITMGVVTALLSVIAGSDLLMATARAGSAMLALGFLLWVINWLLARGALEAARQPRGQTAEEAPAQSSVEWEA